MYEEHRLLHVWFSLEATPVCCEVIAQRVVGRTFRRASTFILRLLESLHEQVKELASREGVSINQFIATAVAEKISALMAEDHLRERAARGSRDKLRTVLARVPDVEPDQHDRL
ncbi:MAG TPA: toxin-antitoxin system HicB family antitoxin [Longimicrobiaceae bacterium]|nr:toxin-antitoxin system HicB family antitoxin [Longimicrobiaceae bacterium]